MLSLPGMFKLITHLTTTIGLTGLLLANIIFPRVGVAGLPAETPNTALQPYTHANPEETPNFEEAYTLGAGDRIGLDIYQLPQYSGEHEVLANGSLNLPQVGSVSVQGMTLEQAADIITARYISARILRRPQVTVSLLAPRPLKIGIAGEIQRPGSYIMAVEGSQLPTVTQAVEKAGGITQAADLHQVQIRRSRSNGSEQAIAIDLWQLLQTGDLRNDRSLRDGDTIYIPTATSIALEEGPKLATASFAAVSTQPLNIAVLGEVRRPGPHTIKGQEGSGGLPTLTQAIQAAGGIKPLADIRRILIRRPTKTGLEQTIEVDLWQLLQASDLQQNLILQNGDTIYVPTVTDINLAEASLLQTASFAPDQSEPINIALVGEVARPGTYTVAGSTRTDNEGTASSGDAKSIPTVTRAIQIAGGITAQADIRKLRIRRFTSAGVEKTIEINLWDLLQAGNPSQDPILQDGDTVVIPTATQLDPAEAAQIASASFSPSTIKVNVVGEVNRPGVVEVPPNTPLNQALLAAGGFDQQRANKNVVEMIRLNPNGSVSRQSISVDFAQGVNEQTNPSLRNNDIIIVQRSSIAGVSDSLNTASGPIDKILSIFSFPFRLLQLF